MEIREENISVSENIDVKKVTVRCRVIFCKFQYCPFDLIFFKEPAEVKIYFWVKNHPVSRLEIEAYANFQDQIERRHYD